MNESPVKEGGRKDYNWIDLLGKDASSFLEEGKLPLFLDIDNTMIHAVISYDIPYGLLKSCHANEMFYFKISGISTASTAPQSSSQSQSTKNTKDFEHLKRDHLGTFDEKGKGEGIDRVNTNFHQDSISQAGTIQTRDYRRGSSPFEEEEGKKCEMKTETMKEKDKKEDYQSQSREIKEEAEDGDQHYKQQIQDQEKENQNQEKDKQQSVEFQQLTLKISSESSESSESSSSSSSTTTTTTTTTTASNLVEDYSRIMHPDHHSTSTSSTHHPSSHSPSASGIASQSVSIFLNDDENDSSLSSTNSSGSSGPNSVQSATPPTPGKESSTKDIHPSLHPQFSFSYLSSSYSSTSTAAATDTDSYDIKIRLIKSTSNTPNPQIHNHPNTTTTTNHNNDDNNNNNDDDDNNPTYSLLSQPAPLLASSGVQIVRSPSAAPAFGDQQTLPKEAHSLPNHHHHHLYQNHHHHHHHHHPQHHSKHNAMEELLSHSSSSNFTSSSSAPSSPSSSDDDDDQRTIVDPHLTLKPSSHSEMKQQEKPPSRSLPAQFLTSKDHGTNHHQHHHHHNNDNHNNTLNYNNVNGTSRNPHRSSTPESISSTIPYAPSSNKNPPNSDIPPPSSYSDTSLNKSSTLSASHNCLFDPFSSKPLYCLVKPRPNLIPFLRSARKFFKIYICTFGSIEYATEIKNRLNTLVSAGDRDNQLPPCFESQIISRETHRQSIVGSSAPPSPSSSHLIQGRFGDGFRKEDAAGNPIEQPDSSPNDHAQHHQTSSIISSPVFDGIPARGNFLTEHLTNHRNPLSSSPTNVSPDDQSSWFSKVLDDHVDSHSSSTQQNPMTPDANSTLSSAPFAVSPQPQHLHSPMKLPLMKSLDRILASIGLDVDPRMCVCIDDRLDIWQHKDLANNLLKIHPYSFFFSHPIYEVQAAELGLHTTTTNFKPPKLNLDTSSVSDSCLKASWDHLSFIHMQFFKELKIIRRAIENQAKWKHQVESGLGTSVPPPSLLPLHISDLPTVATSILKLRSKVLASVTLAYKGKLIPGILELARYYGANILEGYSEDLDNPDQDDNSNNNSSTQSATHLLVASSDIATCRFIRGRQKQGKFGKIHIVTSSWIIDCARDFSHISEKPYLLERKFP